MRATWKPTLLLGSIVFTGLGCGTNPPPFDPQAVQEPYIDRAGRIERDRRQPLPTTYKSRLIEDTLAEGEKPPVPTTGPALDRNRTVRLSLEQCIQRAIAYNNEIQVAGFDPAIEETRVVENQAEFDPAFFTNLQYQRTDNLIASSFFGAGGGIVTGDRIDQVISQTGLRQELQTGGRVELRYEANRSEAGARFDPNPFYESELVFQITQPLLRNFGRDVNRARIEISRNNQVISLLDFRQQVEQTLVDVETTYWRLVAAERDVRIFEVLLEATLDTADRLFLRRFQDVTTVQLSQADASLGDRRVALVRARADVRDLSDRLKRLMNDPTMPVSSSILVLPADQPAEVPLDFDLKDQLETAAASRPELAQQTLRIDSANEAFKVGRNNLLPQLDFIGSIGAQGLGDAYSDAVDEQVDFDNLSYTLGFQLEIPIGNRAARAIYHRAWLQRLQADAQYRSLYDQIILDVKLALREVDTAWYEMVAARQARLARAKTLDSIQLREDAEEPLTPTFVQLKLDTQEFLSDAARRENTAIAAYNIALLELERSKGTLLRYNNVVLDEDDLASGLMPR